MSANPATCRSCGAAILWATSPTGKRIPLDANPHPDGTVQLDAAVARVLKDAELHYARSVAVGPTLYLSHFATCPDAKQWRGHDRR